MSLWTWLWLIWGLAFVIIEGVALANSRAGDTLSEHVWAWTGIARRAPWVRKPKVEATRVRPTWTMRWARCAVVLGMVWLALHLTTGWV